MVPPSYTNPPLPAEARELLLAAGGLFGHHGFMETLTGAQRTRLRGIAHGFRPLVHVGKGLVTPALIASVRAALDDHELIKVKFVAGKDERKQLALDIAGGAGAQIVGSIGNIVILWRRQEDPERRTIDLP
jgi:RNA-binding protein